MWRPQSQRESRRVEYVHQKNAACCELRSFNRLSRGRSAVATASVEGVVFGVVDGPGVFLNRHAQPSCAPFSTASGKRYAPSGASRNVSDSPTVRRSKRTGRWRGGNGAISEFASVLWLCLARASSTPPAHPLQGLHVRRTPNLNSRLTRGRTLKLELPCIACPSPAGNPPQSSWGSQRFEER
jgi:hypothetical protein